MVNQMHQHTNASGGMLVAASDAALSIIHPSSPRDFAFTTYQPFPCRPRCIACCHYER
jgi:hypothetical protein